MSEHKLETHEKDEEWLPVTEEEFAERRNFFEEDEGWTLYDDREDCSVYTRSTEGTKVLCLRVISKKYLDVAPSVLYDVLSDLDYRKVWDTSCLECTTLVRIDPLNEINYYSAHCPTPMSNRDWVNRCGSKIYRKDPSIAPKVDEKTTEYFLFNRTVNYPPNTSAKGFVRALSYITGYLIIPVTNEDGTIGSKLIYSTHNDWNGWIPAALVNMALKKMVPSVLDSLRKACLEYPKWKAEHNPEDKPWIV